jgi:hypothetical protein
VHDVCAPISLAVQAPNDTQRAGIDGALGLWRSHGIGTVRVIAEGGAPGADMIELRFEPAALPFHGLYDDETSVVYVNSKIDDPGPLAIVIAPELGHAFGLPHVAFAERHSLMNPGNLVTPPTEADRAEIEALWGPCQQATRSKVDPR